MRPFHLARALFCARYRKPLCVNGWSQPRLKAPLRCFMALALSPHSSRFVAPELLLFKVRCPTNGIRRLNQTMEQEHTSRNTSLSPEEPLPLPHFDEEATVQSARPVVSLHQVKARSKRRLLLVAALAIAASLGALTSLIYNRRDNPQDASVSTAAPDPSEALTDNSLSASGGAAGLPVNSNPAAVPVNDTESDSLMTTKVEADRRESPNLSNQTSRIGRNSETVASVPVADEREDEILAEERELRRAERREARRLRRQRRVGESRSGDGLTRIREIFEGSPRP